MTKYALINTSSLALVLVRDFDATPPILAIAKGLEWVPYTEIPAAPTEIHVSDGHTEGMEDGRWVRRHRVRDKTYIERRLSVPPYYASMTDQLDMQYRDALSGTTEWRDHIAAVKAAHPKPGV